ncbi:hypothetical protein FFLO_02682 [Filobasidium floriforme]|uniref:Clp R domain-containing protein n=1 Tax=Filobasidium floriforme TaxID=5210 RepID=A0A8K0JP43_9TREE|nr:hypothetical protein FFLO_02682 [Filobasidium floriforme]
MADDLNLTDRSEQLIKQAINLAENNSVAQVHPLHLACALWEPEVEDGTSTSASAQPSSLFQTSFEKAGLDKQTFSRALLSHTNRLPSVYPAPAPPLPLAQGTHVVLRAAIAAQKEQRDSYVAVDHLLLAILKVAKDVPELRSMFTEAKVDERGRKKLEDEIRKARGNRKVDSKSAEEGFESLQKYATDLTALAAEGKLDPVIGRDKEVRRTIAILSRRTKNSAILIGEPGVGKTSIVEGLAQRIVNRDVPASLIGRLFSLDLGSLMAGAKYKGEYEERVKGVLNEIEEKSKEGENIILFVDEAHQMVQGKEQSASSFGEFLKPLLARGMLKFIGATTLAEYREFIEKDAALERRLAQVIVEEPDIPATTNILRGLKERYETYHGCRITDAALVLAAQLSRQYIPARRAPDSAIDVMDEACTQVKIQRETRPEAIDILERQKVTLQMEIHALEKEKDEASKERLEAAQKMLANVEEELAPELAEFEAEKSQADRVQELRRKIDELKAKADDAERRYDLASASDIRYYSIPQRQKELAELEAKEAEKNADGKSGGVVTPEAIAEVVARWTGVPVTALVSSEKAKLLKLEKTLTRSIVGQPTAIKAVSNAIRLSRSGLNDQNRPIFSALLTGPSGSGKTSLAKTLAKAMFNDENAMIRIDCSELSAEHSISRLIGSPQGYVGMQQGGQLTEAVRRKPYQIVLFDEIEKGHAALYKLLLSVLDAGVLTSAVGLKVDFRNTIILFSSNLGSAALAEDASEGEPSDKAKEKVNVSLQAHFPPEFLGRLDEVIYFRMLSRSNIRSIVELRLAEVQTRMIKNGRKLKLNIDEDAKTFLGDAGFSPQYGARPLNKVIQREILNPLSKLILQNSILDGEVVKIHADLPRNRLVVVPNHEPEIVEDEDDDMDIDDDDLEIEEVD